MTEMLEILQGIRADYEKGYSMSKDNPVDEGLFITGTLIRCLTDERFMRITLENVRNANSR